MHSVVTFYQFQRVHTTSFCYFGYVNQKSFKFTLKICLSALVWLFFAEKLSKTVAFKLHHVKEHKIRYQKQ